MKRLTWVLCLLTLACDGSSADDAQALREEADACDRECLIRTAKSLFERPELARDARFTENGQVIALDASWLSSAREVHVHNAYADARAGQVMIVGTALSERSDGADKPAVFGLRAKIHGSQAEELELLVAHKGEASLFPPSLPVETDARYEKVVEGAARDDGETMIGLANRYFDGIQAAGDPELPVADDCNRVENGVQTTRNPRFNDLRCNTLEVFVYIPVVEQRRYPIIDEERGIAVAIVMFQIPGGDYEYELNGEKVMRSYTPRSLYLFEAFKISDGVIHQVEATMRNLDYNAKIDWP
jgi:hypothetical protein